MANLYPTTNWAVLISPEADQAAREEQQRTGRTERYELLRDHIAGERGIAYAELANTVTDHTEVDGEIRHPLDIAVL